MRSFLLSQENERKVALNLLGRIADVYVPASFKKKGLRSLFCITARAYGAEVPSLAGLSYDECLLRFASFTRSLVDEAIDRGRDLRNVREGLYEEAFGLGSSLRKLLGVSSAKDAMAACRIVYRSIGIDFEGTEHGAVIIRKCYFSQYYSGATCDAISWLDKGLVAGLSQGGQLNFTERLSESKSCCRAVLTPSGMTR